MFYKQFLEITSSLDEQFVSRFDYWLATLPTNCTENITTSVVVKKTSGTFAQAERILAYSENKGILEKYYIVRCPNEECDAYLGVVAKDKVASVLMEPQYCDECNESYNITPDDIYVAYKVIKKPDVSEEEIAQAIEQNLHKEEGPTGNFQEADSLKNNVVDLYKSFYNPDESAYEEFKRMREDLDKDYGRNTTEKGKALEQLILKIFKQIKFVNGTNEIKTVTNQFDCTVLSPTVTMYPSIFNYLWPYFIIECKNEPKKKPGNTYFIKLLGIINNNDAKVGIVFSRKPAASTYFSIAHDAYLTTKNTQKTEYLLAMDDRDLKYLIDDRVNLLEYLDFKISSLTQNSRTATWEMYKNH